MIHKIIGQPREPKMHPRVQLPEEIEEIEPKKVVEKEENINLFPELVKPVEENNSLLQLKKSIEENISTLPLKKPKGFQPGKSGNIAGKKKGTINAKTKIIKQFTEDVLAENALQFRKNLKLLGRKNPKQHIDAIIALLEYIVPKKNRTEFIDETKKEERVKEVFIIGGKTLEW